MAREKFIFFTIDLNILGDSKIRRLKRKGNRDKFLVYLSVIKAAYGESGYYVPYNQDLVLDIADDWELEEEYVDNTIRDCVEIGLFSKEMFDKGILTSKGLQERYLEMCKRSRWVKYEIAEEYNVLEKSAEENSENVAETPKNVAEKGGNVTKTPQNVATRADRIIKDNINNEGTEVPMSVKTDAGLFPIEPNDEESDSESEEKADKEKADKETSAKVRVNWQNLIAFWNETTNGAFPPITSIENKRRQMASTRISEYGKEKFIEAIRRAVQSDFLRGQNARGFILTFDWLIRPNNFPKVLEGNYDNNTTTRTPQTQQNNGTASKQRNPKFADFGETMAAIKAGINAGITERGISPDRK